MSDLKWLDEIEALAKAATPGPWEYYQGDAEHQNYPIAMLADGHSCCGVFPKEGEGVFVPLDAQIPNGEFIASINPATVLRLTAMIRKAGEALDEIYRGRKLLDSRFKAQDRAGIAEEALAALSKDPSNE